VKITGLDGKVHNWIYAGNTSEEESNKSNLHIRARKLLKTMFPLDRIMEEVHLPGSFGLRLDFFLPTRVMAIEVHGEQHYKYNSFFYSSKMEFVKAKKRDANKIEWCRINGIRIAELPYNEGEEQWMNRIYQC
jgi:hypothetical protein